MAIFVKRRPSSTILDAILNFSKCSRVTKVHPADSENRPPGLPKTIKKKTYTDISRNTAPVYCLMEDVVIPFLEG